MTTPVPIKVELDLTALYLAAGYEGRETVADRIIELAATQLVERANGMRHGSGADYDFTWLDSLRTRVESIRTEAIRDAVWPAIEAELARETEQTDGFGNSRGCSTTLAEQITAQVRAWLTEMQGDSFGNRKRQTRLSAMIADQVNAALLKEFHAELEAGKAQIRKALREQGARLLAEAIEKQAVMK